MALPAIIFLIIFNYLPMFGVVLAFKQYNYTDGIFASPWSGFENFKFLFATSDAWNITRNTLLYNALFIVLGLILSVALAIVFNEIKSRFMSRMYQVLTIMPYFLSWVVAGFIFYAFLNVDKGYLNSLLQSLGFDPIAWYSETKYWPYILVFAHLWKSIGYTSVIYLASIMSISSEYYEAAVIDGASKWKQIWHITIPALKPMMIILTILAIGKIFYADFGLFFQVPRDSGQLYEVTQVIDTYVYNGLKTLGNIGMSAAANFYQSIIGFVLVLVSNLVVRKIDKEQALF
ncbi:ABC transporter permease subunit [Paenibacillus sp. FSL R10-2734]|uniref:ABC transporter permease n=1 Tax=Paenibacillus sp. FSL R10-2734 TaxID=2954691 RepID=UPI0030D7AAA1